MTSLDDVDTETVLSGRSDWVSPDLAGTLAAYPLDGIGTEFPHYVGSVDGPDDFEPPRESHPVFYGCFDWHSAVHGHWCLVRQLRLFDDHPDETDIVERIDAGLTPANVEREADYLADNPSFEKPYGWAWLLRLVAELHRWDDARADDWRATLRPLEEQVVDLVGGEFLSQARPFRVGTHDNSAFALGCVLDYARETGRDTLAAAAADRSREWFLADEDYPVGYEPLGWDFLSPALTEADLIRPFAAVQFKTLVPVRSSLTPFENSLHGREGI